MGSAWCSGHDDGSSAVVAAAAAVQALRVVAEAVATPGQVARVVHVLNDLKTVPEWAHGASLLNAAATSVEGDF